MKLAALRGVAFAGKDANLCKWPFCDSRIRNPQAGVPVVPVLALISVCGVSLIYAMLLLPFPILLPSSGGKTAPELRCHSQGMCPGSRGRADCSAQCQPLERTHLNIRFHGTKVVFLFSNVCLWLEGRDLESPFSPPRGRKAFWGLNCSAQTFPCRAGMGCFLLTTKPEPHAALFSSQRVHALTTAHLHPL